MRSKEMRIFSKNILTSSFTVSTKILLTEVP